MFAGTEWRAYTGGRTESAAIATSSLRLPVLRTAAVSESVEPRAQSRHERRTLQRLPCSPLFFCQPFELAT